VYGWGRNYSGQLGNRSNYFQLKPVEIEFFNGVEVEQIGSGDGHTIVLCSIF